MDSQLSVIFSKTKENTKQINSYKRTIKDVVSFCATYLKENHNLFLLENFLLEVLVTNNNEVSKINSSYRSINKPTNVISLQYLSQEEILEFTTKPSYPICLGQLFISIDTLRTEAKELNITLDNYFIIIVIHGFLHLLGYNHLNEYEANQMESLEDNILKNYNIYKGLISLNSATEVE